LDIFFGNLSYPLYKNIDSSCPLILKMVLVKYRFFVYLIY